MKPIIYIDMDDTTASFIGDPRHDWIPIEPTYIDYPAMHKEGFFRDLKPIDGAIENIKKLIASDLFEIYILSVPLYTNPHSYKEKAEWIIEHLPELSKRIILTQDKSLLKGNYLIDDSIHWKAVWETDSKRKFIQFNPRKNTRNQWQDLVNYFLITYGKK